MTPAQYDALLAAPLNAALWRNIDVTPAQYNGIIAAIQAAGIAIGNAVAGGGANRVLYEDGAQLLAANVGLTFSPSLGLSLSQGSIQAILCKANSFAGRFVDAVRTVSLADGTNAVTYVAATAANWAASTPPTDVWIALDRCAAALTTLLAPP